MKYYVYCLIDPRNNQPFYVGKGYGQRMRSHESETRSNRWNNTEKCKRIQAIWDAGLEVQYTQEFCESDEYSRIREKELILQYGRLCNNSGILTNVHVGGNGGGRIGKPVFQYDQSGNFISKFVSASDAERQTGVSLSEITAVCRGDWTTAGGYQWKWKNDQPIKNYTRENTTNRIKVYQYTMVGRFVAEYVSQSEATKQLGVTNSTKISLCCAGNLPSYMTFQWKLHKFISIPPIMPQKKAVAQYTINNEFISQYESIAHAHKITGVNGIGMCCNGRYSQAGGFRWAFVVPT